MRRTIAKTLPLTVALSASPIEEDELDQLHSRNDYQLGYLAGLHAKTLEYPT